MLAALICIGMLAAGVSASVGAAEYSERALTSTRTAADFRKSACHGVRKHFRHGLAQTARKARSYAKAGNFRPTVSANAYRKNRGKDRDHDGVICGVRKSPGGVHAQSPSTPTPSTPPSSQSGDVTIAAVGDIACSPLDANFNGGLGQSGSCYQKYVADAIYSNFGSYFKVMPLGDIQYDSGSYANFLGSYDLSWGRLGSKIAPVLGNHESGGQGYFDYFNGVGVMTGSVGTRDKGWYTFDTGTSLTSGWHIVALNSECVGQPCAAEQLSWLQNDLAANNKPCTLAYWHKPRFSSGPHGNDPNMQPFWNLLTQYGGELVLSGHDHDYERFAPLNAVGSSDPTQGVRQFVVGTGGRSQYPVGTSPATEVANATTYGFLELTLKANSYDWRFVRTNSPGNGTFADSGSGSCHA